jgi:hypothetical protein
MISLEINKTMRRERRSRQRQLSCPLFLASNWNSFAFVIGIAVALIAQTEAFFIQPIKFTGGIRHRPRPFSRPLFYGGGSSGNEKDGFDAGTLSDRLQEMRVNMMEEDLLRPPNPDLSPQEFVLELLRALWENSEPMPDSGFRVLLRTSTEDWRSILYQSVGAPASADQEVVASALGEAMGRPKNQFAILVAEAEKYVSTFPSEPLNYADVDGTCWVECRLRESVTNELLVVIGWQLEQRSDGAWLVDGIDWQDFRDKFRPGIGREEWVRICG